MFTDMGLVEILAEEQILSLPTPNDPLNQGGLYFLLLGPELVYVGMSRFDIPNRISAHRKNAAYMRFDRFATIGIKTWNIELVEAIYIHRFRPMFNIDIPRVGSLARRRKPEELMTDDEHDERSRLVAKVRRFSEARRRTHFSKIQKMQEGLEKAAIELCGIVPA